MKTITKTIGLVFATFLLSLTIAHAQCSAGFTWSQTTNNVIDFTNTSSPIIPNSTSFFWSFGDNQSDWTQNPSHTYSNPGTYYVCVTILDSSTSCYATFCDSVTVFGNVLCNTTTTAGVGQAATCSTCADGTAYATMNNGTAPYIYSWSSGGTGQVESGLAPGVYSVCITDANGCSSCDSVYMNYSSSNCSASFTWSQTNPNEIDFLSTSTGISAQTMYYWSWGDNSSSFNNSSNTISHLYANPGTYYVCLTIYDSLNFCSSTYCDSVTVWGNVLPTVCDANFVIYPDSVNTNQAWAYNLSTGGPNMTYQWFWGDNSPVDVVPYPSHVYASTGTYNICLVVVDTANSCSDTMCIPLWVPRLSQQAAMAPYYVNVIPMGIREQTQVAFTLFPNPASTEIKIKSDYSLQGKQFSILDVTGRSVLSGTLSGTTINVDSLDNGVYMLQIENSNGGFSAQRFMKD